jgi:putative transposase
MALSESARSTLVESLAAADGGVDLIRELARWALQELIEAEAADVIGAGRYERTDGRVTERNGHRARVLSTKAGDLSLQIPKLRKGSFFPSLLEPRRRIDQALYAVVMEAYVQGVSTRSVDDLVAAMGIDTGISKSEVSRICAGLDERVHAFRNRTLGHVRFPYVYLDATYVNVRDDALGQVVSRAVVVATGVTADGGREVLGVDVGDSEDETFWTAFLRSLKARGLAGVRLVISDAHAGLKAAIRKTMQGATWQRCRVHYARNLLATVPKAHHELVSAAFRTIFALTTAAAVRARWDEVTDTLTAQFPKAAASMREARDDVLAFTTFPPAHWRKIWSNNPLERLNKEIKRRTNVVGIFPNDTAVIRLVGAVLADQHDDWITARRYLTDTSLAELDTTRETDPAQHAELQPGT